MSTNPYQIRGPHVPGMLGRKELFEHVIQQLTKSEPQHLSVVGMQLSGKTVLLNSLLSHINDKTEEYVAAFRWDFREMTPETDHEFMVELAGQIRTALVSVNSEEAEYIDNASEDIVGDICLALDELWKRKKRILVIFDGFDNVLAADKLTPSLWDNLLSLARKSGIIFITGSRDRLRNLLKHNARPSIFWDQFYQEPVLVGRFTENDFDGLTIPFQDMDISFNDPAKKEFFHETGGNSVLAIGLLQLLYDQTENGVEITGEIVKEAGEDGTQRFRETIETLWGELGVDARGDIGSLEARDLTTQEISENRFKFLENQGFAVISKRKYKSSCRMFYRYACVQAQELFDVKRLFSTEEGFDNQIKNLLELRLSQIEGGDESLIEDIKRAIRELPAPSYAVKWARTIVIRALNLVWKAELDDNKKIPELWVNEWKSSAREEKYQKPYFDTRKVPERLGHQCELLDRITGTEHNKSVAKFVSKSTYTLVAFLNIVGNFGEHQNEEVQLGYAAAVCYTTIELCRNLSRELK
jgi:hypothetical protein